MGGRQDRGGRGMISIPKNAREEIQVATREYNGRRYIDVRVCFEGKDGAIRPTAKGVTLRHDLADALADAIRAVAAEEGQSDG